MSADTSSKLKFSLGIIISVIGILGFFGINKFTDLFGNKEKEAAQNKQHYFHGSEWIGSWTDKDQHDLTYTAKMKLSVSMKGNIDGAIRWKLLQSNYVENQHKIGMEASEIISGDYNPENKKVTLTGIDEMDPNDIMKMAIYNLELSEDGKKLNGFDNLTGGIVEFERIN